MIKWKELVNEAHQISEKRLVKEGSLSNDFGTGYKEGYDEGYKDAKSGKPNKNDAGKAWKKMGQPS